MAIGIKLPTCLLFVLGVTLLGTTGCQDKQETDYEVKVTPGTPTAPIAAAPVEGDTIELRVLDQKGIEMLVESHRGKVVVLDYWSTSCPPCIAEFPNLVALDEKYTDDKLVCISVSLDYLGLKKKGPEDYKPEIMLYLEKFKAKFDNIIAAEDSDTMLAKLKLGSPPAVFVYAASGELAKRFDNESAMSEEEAFTYEDVNKVVDELMGEGEGAGE
ncbi:MAG: hypothetical protein COA78_03960 [Blastopirellula sp.]|nr:MAG: hypothetical protein COA78_03960 [Blastopirellula sp.]